MAQKWIFFQKFKPYARPEQSGLRTSRLMGLCGVVVTLKCDNKAD